MNRDFKGIWIPAALWLSPDLSLIERVMLAELDSLDGQKGCFASNAYLAELFGISSRRIQQVLESLKEKKHIKIHVKRDKENRVEKRTIKVISHLLKPSTPHEENFVTLTKNISPPSRNIFRDPHEENFVYITKEDNKEDNKEREARAPRFTSWFAAEWGIQGELSHRAAEAIQALTDGQMETIGEHLPKYLKAKGSWAGTPERYLIDKKYTEAIYQTPTKSNGTPKPQAGPPTPRKRNYKV